MYHNKQMAFTLMELMVALIVLSIISGLVVTSYSGIKSDGQIDAAVFEMQQLKKALLAYQNDVQKFPPYNENGTIYNRIHSGDMSFLYINPFDATDARNQWNVEYALGWNGPYLAQGDGGDVIIGDNLLTNGSGNPKSGNQVKAIGMPSPFRYSVLAGGFYQWFIRGTSETVNGLYGRPYFLFDLQDKTKARIVSHGLNGRYDSSALVGSCVNRPEGANGNDDLVVCLYE